MGGGTFAFVLIKGWIEEGGRGGGWEGGIGEYLMTPPD